ncbi:ribonucleotide reductase subunit alpha [Marinobacter sp. CHS3-4]|uniref:ribonucleotide reductase subunit alpha n=1 Tax=Marinobacter sp. CHS3-4 TaxID=3045174 RepID=UPI0024B55398|nr:ribonucleotide reductase subunit alpha [Marinobacter sp. CHS3-4]MDI9244132.1 ribonucleotide reductase subunit alpha [Marinobacter sp. CHS3-4]
MISSYSDLIQVSRTQQELQRLLFVFCRAELPDQASPEERASFERGEGGALTPVVCVDKTPDEAAEFSVLVEESKATGQSWDIVFVATMSGHGGFEPSSDQAQQPLNMMVESIRLGHISNFLPLNTKGEAISLK